MNNRTLRALAGSASLAVLATISITPAWAQDAAAPPQTTTADAPAAADEAADAPIVVTGSRIRNPELSASVPVQAVTSETIANTGAVNLQDVLLKNPTMGTPSISRTNSSFANSSAGVATLDLRNLGIDRTLVLIDGRRVVSGVPGSAAVDFNTIPATFIERVDILTGGASAVYGSDAVAGVVNIIYKNKFEGIELNAKQGVSRYGDDSESQIDLTAGASLGDGRGNIMAYIGYSKQGQVMLADRFTELGRSDQDQTSLAVASTGVIDDLFKPLTRYSSYSPQGRYFTDTNIFSYNAAGQLYPAFDANGDQIAALPTYNRSAQRYLAVPVERFLGAFKGNYEISPAFDVFFDGTFAASRAKTNIEAFPFDTSYVTASGQIPIESRYNGTIVANPYVPAAIFNDASDTDGDGLRDIFVTKRTVDLGARTSDAKRTTFRLTGGVRGEIAPNWRYETYLIYGQTNESQTGTGQVNVLNFANALNAAVDTADINNNGNRTEIICVDATARAQGCVPANFFGPGSLASAASYLAAPTSLETFTSQFVAGANVTGQLFSLFGADPIGVSIGAEYRKEHSESTPDVLTQQGLNANNKIPPTNGSFDVKEGFAELLVPLIQDAPFFHSLSLRGAVRVSEYSSVGRTFSYNYGAEWAPTADIRFRVTRSQSTRAPNINELFGPVSQDFPSNLTDPCKGITATTTGALADRCRAAPGVNANIAANGAFAVSQSDQQGITSFAGGNPRLQEERGKSWVAGVVLTPRSINALRNMSLTVDYFDINVDDAIVSTPLQFILNQCYQEGVSSFCDFIVRRPTVQGSNNAGSLDQVNGGLTNSGGLRTRGIDTTFTWRQAITDWASANLRVSYTHLLDGYVIPLPGSSPDYFAGEIGAAKDRFNATLNFEGKSWGLTFDGTYIGASYVDDQIVTQLTDAAGNAITDRHDRRARVSPEFYLDVQARFKVADHYEFYLGADNVLNNRPPFLADIGAATGMATDTGTYDALGRRYYAGVRLKF